MINRMFPLMAIALFTSAASAATTVCINPNSSYVAKPLNNSEIYVESTFGAKKPPVRVSTTCYGLHSAMGFGFSGEFNCISQGDTVVANVFNEHRSCRVTKVQPYQPQKDDLPIAPKVEPDK